MLRKVILGVGAMCALLPLQTQSVRAAAQDIVLTAADAVHLHGHWSRALDASAAGGQLLTSPDAGWAQPNAASASPTHHVDFTFTPEPNTKYRVWLRLRAASNSKYNDSLFLQFTHALDGNTVRYQIGTSDALLVNLQRCNGCALNEWGWINGAYWLAQPTTVTFASGRSQTLRVQTREDGVQIDQIVLSPATYTNAPPGRVSGDTSLLTSTLAPSVPMTGTPIPVPGVVNAEMFDAGAPGVAYHDTSSNNEGRAARTTEVDLQASSEGGYNLGWIAAGEWVNYSVDVATAGEYTLEARVASAGTGGAFHINFAGDDKTGTLTIPNTGGWQKWTSIATAVNLQSGPQVMKVVFDSAGDAAVGNLAWIRLTADAPPEPPPAAAAATATFYVAAGGSVQTALDDAQPGDTILLEAGATFVGNFVLPVKSGDGYITIRSSASDAVLPGEGVRISPSHAAHLPKLRSPSNVPALATAAGAHHYRLQFLEFQANANGAGDILRLGDGSSQQNSLDLVPHHLVVDRVYVHGDPALGQKRGIALNSAATSIVNSYIADIKAVGQDSQAIAGWNGPGPFLIANNYLEGAGENVLFGGADPAIPNLVPSDITFTGNHLSKPWAWRGSQWQVKNLFELKSAQRVLIDGNLMENNWLAAQAGYAILLKSVNQDGRAPWSIVQDVVFSNNIVRHVSSAINILGRDTRYPALVANHITIRNNLFDDVSATKYGGAGRFLMINGGDSITIDHNTVINDGSTTVYADGLPSTSFVFTNNVVKDNAYGLKGGGTAVGGGTIATYFPGGQFFGSLFVGAKPALYPAGNYFPIDMNAVGFVDSAGGDYRLSEASIYGGGATDGTDPGYSANGGGMQPPSLPSGPAPAPAPQPAPTLPGLGSGPSPSPSSPSAPPPSTGSGLSGAIGAPRDVRAVVSGSTVTISWSAPATGQPTTYVLEAGTSPGASNAAMMNTGGTRTSLVATAVAAGVYYVRLRAANGSGTSAASAEVRVTVGTTATECARVPSAPVGLHAVVQGLAVTLRWNGSSCGATHYRVLAGSTPGASNLAQAAVGGMTLSAVAPAGTYYIRVVAINAAGESAPSNEVTVTLRP